MKTQVVNVPTIKLPVALSPGFAKKKLSDWKLDLIALCQFGCLFCSSNWGNYLRMRRKQFASLTEKQLGVRSTPSDNPNLMFVWRDIIEAIEQQLARHPWNWGHGQTLVVSMLTDAFSPLLVRSGTTRRALELLVERTQFRIRILTKNAIVGTDDWIAFFLRHRDRFVVGLSTGTTDDVWTKKIELFTPLPTSRLKALRNLQDAGIATYGMMCPIFPDVLEGDRLEQLVDQIRPDRAEHIWAEPYNDRRNWKAVREGYAPGNTGYDWMTRAYEAREPGLWSAYATELYLRLRRKAQREGWLSKLRYLLYEGNITEQDALEFRGLRGVLLQSKPADDSRSRNPHIAALQ